MSRLTTDRRNQFLNQPGPDGQNLAYLVLSEEERAKGFVRPVRRSYCHVGIPGPQFPTRPLTSDERDQHAGQGWVAFETYPAGHRGAATGRYWSQEDLDRAGGGCGHVTTMSRPIAETYARQPQFYGATFCVGCGRHFPVGEDGEFVWEGSTTRVGS